MTKQDANLSIARILFTLVLPGRLSSCKDSLNGTRFPVIRKLDHQLDLDVGYKEPKMEHRSPEKQRFEASMVTRKRLPVTVRSYAVKGFISEMLPNSLQSFGMLGQEGFVGVPVRTITVSSLVPNGPFPIGA